MTTNITIYSLILISVSTNKDMCLIVLPLLHSAFAYVFCLELKPEERRREPEGSLKIQILSYLSSIQLFS